MFNLKQEVLNRYKKYNSLNELLKDVILNYIEVEEINEEYHFDLFEVKNKLIEQVKEFNLEFDVNVIFKKESTSFMDCGWGYTREISFQILNIKYNQELQILFNSYKGVK
jgi:hypothetical protein